MAVMHLPNVKLRAKPSSFVTRKWKGPTLSTPALFVLGERDTDTSLHSLKKLRERLKEQREHLNVLEKHISELESGEGEQQK